MLRANERLGDGSELVLVEYTADDMSAHDQAVAREVFGVPVASQYGASETPAIAGQCPHGALHMAIDQCIVEFLRADGTAADPDEQAELVITPLHNYAMPLIRYRVGDLGSYSSQACSCGVTLPVMNLGVGKTVDLITTSRATAVSAHVLDYANLLLIREGVAGIRQFFVEQLELDRFRLSYVSDGAPADQALATFVAIMRQHLGEQVVVECTCVGDIPASPTGKRRYFKNSRTDR
jgi:phenylacetate-CoA ligase